MERLDAYARKAGGNHLKPVRRFQGNVEDTIPFERTSVVNADHDGAIVGEVRHFEICSERQRAMGGSQFVHVETLAAGRLATMILLAVVRSDTDHRSRRCRARAGERLRARSRGATAAEQGHNRQYQECFGSVNLVLAHEKPM